MSSGFNATADKERSMKRLKRNEHREERIDVEIIADAYDEEERAMGWYYYLADMLVFPFRAKCIHTRPHSPLEEDEVVEVVGMALEKKCLREIFVEIKGDEQNISVPLAQLQGIAVDEETQEAIEDWHYWVGRGYGF